MAHDNQLCNGVHRVFSISISRCPKQHLACAILYNVTLNKQMQCCTICIASTCNVQYHLGFKRAVGVFLNPCLVYTVLVLWRHHDAGGGVYFTVILCMFGLEFIRSGKVVVKHLFYINEISITLGNSGRLSSCSFSGSFAFWSSGVGRLRVRSHAATRFRKFAITMASSLGGKMTWR